MGLRNFCWSLEGVRDRLMCRPTERLHEETADSYDFHRQRQGGQLSCTPTSATAASLHQLAEHHQQSAEEPRYGVADVDTGVINWVNADLVTHICPRV